MMAVYVLKTSIFFVKRENLPLMCIGKRPWVVFIPISTASNLKPIKLVQLSHCCYNASVYARSFWNSLKNILYKSSYPHDFIDKCMKEILDKLLTSKTVKRTWWSYYHT